MKVKICGITDLDTASAAVENGADAIGLVFTKSKRKVELDKALGIVRELPARVMKVGVFVNESKGEMERIASYVGLTHLQLHGDETPEFCQTLSMPVIKALSIQNKENFKEIRKFSCDYILLDGPNGKYRGGNGEAFDWNLFKAENFPGKQFILAGGLTEDNVLGAIDHIHPFMVDVSSGVETKGIKDYKKIKSFIDKVKENFNGGIIG